MVVGLLLYFGSCVIEWNNHRKFVEESYYEGLRLHNVDGKKGEAYLKLTIAEEVYDVSGYKDYIRYEGINEMLREAQTGDLVCLGKWIQGKRDDEKTDIQWIVVERNDNTLLLVSKYIVEDIKMEYVSEFGGRVFENMKTIPWENSSVRAWINGDFYENAFVGWEKELIMNVTVPASDGSHVEDKGYIFSESEMEKYLVYDKSVKLADWWIRGEDSFMGTSYVDKKGKVSSCKLNAYGKGIRPVIRVKIPQN